MTKELLWKPSQEHINTAQMTEFMQYVQKTRQIEISDYAALHAWSTHMPQEFWEAVWTFCNIRPHTLYHTVMEKQNPIYNTRWFVGSQLNYAEHLLTNKDDNQTALVFYNEQGFQQRVSFSELYRTVAQLAATLKRYGVSTGDRVAAIMPNMPETIIAFLATASIGAIWSCCSPDFGTQGIVDRFGQIEPKVLFTVDNQLFHGKTNSVVAKLPDLLAQIPSIQHTIVIPYLTTPDISTFPNTHFWNDALTPDSSTIEFASRTFDDPLYILYSSGTTGKPKCIVHRTGGVLLQHLKELRLHTNLKTNDVFFYYTTCGWMMWNWLVSGLAVGATLVLYDGAPTHPSDSVLIDLIDQERINVFGISARYLARLEKVGLTPNKTHDLTSLRTILSTGSPLLVENFHYVYEHIKKDVCLSSISGGTDIVSCFALGNPILPVYTGELQCRGLGMAIEVYNEQGESVVGEKGELVCTQPFPVMPVGFWNDTNHEKFHNAYFAKYPNVWTHGDYAELTSNGGVIIYGRSDTTLNPGGVRIGTAEIYRQVEQISEIEESLVIGQQWRNDERIILFVKLPATHTLDDALKFRIKKIIRDNTSPRHVPAKIIQVPDIPRTISGKIVELAVRNIIHGVPVTNREALANPDSLTFFEQLEELKSGDA